ncbi:SCF ubiquitin ligase complex subunit cdc4 [Marasmius tenuissimus]|uniref:SCF ubiquitin ligase complex subunit cdc4 n=1 Tax=Marasmius tenuissimus TaxID=585030 RepID=A0ABR2ZAC0_9AGAR
MSESEIYARLFYPLRHGYPLWCPDPNDALSDDYKANGIQIGDVGVVTEDGGFDFAFNVLREADDPINEFGVPHGFVPLGWDGRKRENRTRFPPNIPLHSRHAERRDINVSASVTVPGAAVGVGGGLGIKFNSDKGAVLMLPGGGRRIDCHNLLAFEHYAKEHAVSWYQFVNGILGRNAPNGSLYFITGFDHAHPWETVLVQNDSREYSCELEFNPELMPGVELGGFGLKLSKSSTIQTGVTWRCSRSTRGTNDNQPIFIRGFRVSIQRTLLDYLFRTHRPALLSTWDPASTKEILDKPSGSSPFSRGKWRSSSHMYSPRAPKNDQEQLDRWQRIIISDLPGQETSLTDRTNILDAMEQLSNDSGFSPKCLRIQDVDIIVFDRVLNAHTAGMEVFEGKVGTMDVTIKVLKGSAPAKEQLKMLLKRAITWRKLHHDNVLPFLGFYYFDESRSRVCVVYPGKEQHSLSDGIPGELAQDFNGLDKFANGIIDGLKHIHGQNITHGDLQSSSFLIDQAGVARIADLGLAQLLGKAVDGSQESDRHQCARVLYKEVYGGNDQGLEKNPPSRPLRVSDAAWRDLREWLSQGPSASIGDTSLGSQDPID